MNHKFQDGAVEEIRLSESQIDQIAERAATKALEKVYAGIGKGVMTKAAWLIGFAVLALLAWLAGSGRLP